MRINRVASLMICLFLVGVVGCDNGGSGPKEAGARIAFDVDLGNLKTEPVVTALQAKAAQMKPYANRDVTLVVRGVGDATFFAKDGKFVMSVTANCKFRENPTRKILQEFDITVETADLGEALATEIVQRLKK